ncbi:MAG: hypothetical protein R3B13_24140 [Polyangiaceae bacterium]
MRKWMMAGAVGLFGLWATPASAQEFGEQGTPALFAERLFGFYISKKEVDLPNGNEAQFDYSGFGIGFRSPVYYTPYELPRIGFDYFVIDSLSIGGALGYAQSQEDGDPDDEVSLFLIAPRVGYVWMFSDVVGFWLRGGFTYHSINVDPGNGEEDALALTGEGMFVISPTPHFGFIVGPTFDISITGEDNNRDQRYRSFGIFNAGVGGWF